MPQKLLKWSCNMIVVHAWHWSLINQYVSRPTSKLTKGMFHYQSLKDGFSCNQIRKKTLISTWNHPVAVPVLTMVTWWWPCDLHNNMDWTCSCTSILTWLSRFQDYWLSEVSISAFCCVYKDGKQESWHCRGSWEVFWRYLAPLKKKKIFQH